MTNNKPVIEKSINGGYYALKGFTYQFDKSILEAIENPNVKHPFS